MKKAFIAGGAGFIGSHICKRLLDEGYFVVCMDNFITGDKKNVEKLKHNKNFIFIERDVCKNEIGTLKELEQLDFIFHLASPASPNATSPRSYIKLPIETMMVNSVGTHNLLKLALARKSKFLYSSTSEIYGNPAISPQPESYWGNVSTTGIRSVYDESKRFSESLVSAYVRLYNLDARIVRIFNTYGPNMQKDDGRVISNFINQALEKKALTIYGDGSQTRSFCFVDDMVEGVLRAMTREGTKGEVINLGNPDERSISQISELVKNLINKNLKSMNLERPEDDPEIRKPDISKAKKLLGWSPEVKLEDGLKRTIEYFRSV